jgi:hypothetical protein
MAGDGDDGTVRPAATMGSPWWESEQENSMRTERFEGEKYTGFRSATDIAKDIRSDIKEAISAGKLPKDLKVSVRSRYYAGGQSIDMTWSATSGTHRIGDYHGRPDVVLSARGQHIEHQLKKIAHAYNYDNSDITVDYFDTMFYCTPQWDYQVRLKASNIEGLDARVAEVFLVLYKDGTPVTEALEIAKKLEATA